MQDDNSRREVRRNSTARATLEALRVKGCVCGDETPVWPCPLHPGPSDNRGLKAFFLAGMPKGFPMRDCTCSLCGCNECLIYPNIELDDPKRSGEFRRTLICPKCSKPVSERELVADAIQFGYELNDARVF